MKKTAMIPALLGALLLGMGGCNPPPNAGINPPQPAYTGNSSLPNPWIMYDGQIHFVYGQGGSGGFQIYDYITGTTVKFSDSAQTLNGMNSFSITLPAAGSHNYEEPIFLNQASDYSGGGFTTGTLQVMATGNLAGLKLTANILGSAASPAVTLTNNWQQVTCTLPANLTHVTSPLEVNIFGFSAYPFTVYVTDVVVQ